MKIFLFGFKNNISERIVKILDCKDSKKFYLQGVNDIRLFTNIIKSEKPDYILGFGEFSKSADYFLLEKYCSNKFRGKIYGTKFEKLEISGFLEEDKKSKLKSSSTIGTSYCNFASYLISKTISNNKLPTKFSFLHVPKNFNFLDN